MKVLMLSRAKWIQSKYNTRRTLGRQTRRWWEQQRALKWVVTTLFPNVSRQSVVSVRALPVLASVRHPWHEAMSSPVIRRRGSSVCVDALNLNSPSLTLVSLSLSFFCLFHLLYITQPHTVLPSVFISASHAECTPVALHLIEAEISVLLDVDCVWHYMNIVWKTKRVWRNPLLAEMLPPCVFLTFTSACWHCAARC